MPQAVWPLRSEYSLSQRPSGLSLLGAGAQPAGAWVFWACSVLSGGPTGMLVVWLEFSWSAGVSGGGEVIAKPAQQLSLKFLFLCSVGKKLQWILGTKWTGEVRVLFSVAFWGFIPSPLSCRVDGKSPAEGQVGWRWGCSPGGLMSEADDYLGALAWRSIVSNLQKVKC